MLHFFILDIPSAPHLHFVNVLSWLSSVCKFRCTSNTPHPISILFNTQHLCMFCGCLSSFHISPSSCSSLYHLLSIPPLFSLTYIVVVSYLSIHPLSYPSITTICPLSTHTFVIYWSPIQVNGLMNLDDRTGSDDADKLRDGYSHDLVFMEMNPQMKHKKGDAAAPGF